ncbi:MAG TPA: BON domain-containing protein [Thermoleophilaceae bacterium]
MNSDVAIEDDLRELLLVDQRISDPGAIAVSANHGLVTLRGTVGTFAARRAAVKDARSVEGVDEVDDQLQVRLLDEDRRADADIRGVVLQTLEWDSRVPAELIDVKVADGWITLKGDANYQFQSDAAFDDVTRLGGVIGITNEIRVTTP